MSMAIPYDFRLQKNYQDVLKDLEPLKVLSYLFQDGIFDQDDMDDVKSEKTRKKKAEKLLEKILRSGIENMQTFVNALSKTQPHLYKLLQQPVANEDLHSEGVPVTGHSTGSILSFSGLHIEPPPYNPQYKDSGTPVEHEGETANKKPSSGHHEELPPHLGNTDIQGSPQCQASDYRSFVQPTDLNKIPARNHPGSDLVYKMTAKPRGIALIINNETFSSESEPGKTYESELTKKEQLEVRLGSQQDVEQLEELFEALDFKVKTKTNQSREQILKVLDDTAADPEHKNYDCFVLWLMTHGEEGILYGSDGGTVHVETVRDMFSNSRCQDLIGKPKLFFIQACRGRKRDVGVVADSPQSLNPPPIQPSTGDDQPQESNESSSRHWRFNLKDTIPAHADILVAHSTVRGYAAFRNTEMGSRFVRCIVEVFQEYAGHEDLISMLTMVNDRVSKMGEIGSKQVSQPETTLRKKLFFWPGNNTQSSD